MTGNPVLDAALGTLLGDGLRAPIDLVCLGAGVPWASWEGFAAVAAVLRWSLQ